MKEDEVIEVDAAPASSSNSNVPGCSLGELAGYNADVEQEYDSWKQSYKYPDADWKLRKEEAPAEYWWRLYTDDKVPLLAQYCLFWLSRPVGTAIIERFFSLLKLVADNFRRARLSEKRLQQLMILAAHRDWLHQQMAIAAIAPTVPLTAENRNQQLRKTLALAEELNSGIEKGDDAEDDPAEED
jgi:hypothetical protein